MFHSVVRHWTSVWKETRPFTNPFKESAKFFGGCFWLVGDAERRPLFCCTTHSFVKFWTLQMISYIDPELYNHFQPNGRKSKLIRAHFGRV
jgi:hypothetical protein